MLLMWESHLGGTVLAARAYAGFTAHRGIRWYLVMPRPPNLGGLFVEARA